jgi:hypothetical protein
VDPLNPRITIRIWGHDAGGWWWQQVLPGGVLSKDPSDMHLHRSYNAARAGARAWANREGYGRIDYVRGDP